MDARNSAAHFAGRMSAREAIRYLDAMRELALAIGGGAQVKIIGSFYDEQLAEAGGEKAAEPRLPGFGEPRATRSPPPWREVCQPHPDVLSARFSDAEFAANLALVDQGVGSEEYVDPAAFFRITYATEGLTRVLTSTLERLAGKAAIRSSGSKPILAGAKRTPCWRSTIWHALPRRATAPRTWRAWLLSSRPRASARSTAPAAPSSLGRTGRRRGDAHRRRPRDPHPLGLPRMASRGLGGRRRHRRFRGGPHQPGSERMIPILRGAAPCIVLLDEVVAFARQLRGLE